MAATLPRRDVLRIAVIGAAAVPFALGQSHDTAAASAENTVLAGTVLAVQGDLIRVRSNGGGKVVPVRASSASRMYSGAFGQIESPNAFICGDRVLVEGRWRGHELQATSIGSLLTPLTAVVTHVSRDGSVADTTEGVVELTKGKLPFTSPQQQRRLRSSKVKRGTRIQGLAWTNPATGDKFLLVGGG